MSNLTAISWTMRNSLGAVPPGLRGPMYTENRLMVIGRVLIMSTHAGLAIKGDHTVGAWHNERSAHAEAVSLTAVNEDDGWLMQGAPRIYEVGDGLYSKVLEMNGHDGPSEFLDSLFFLVLNGGKDAA